MACWRQLLLIRARIHQDFILTLCFRQTKMSPQPAATDTFVTNAAPDGRGGDVTAGRSRPNRSERMVNTAVVSFISVTQSSSLDAPKSLTQLENGLQLFGH